MNDDWVIFDLIGVLAEPSWRDLVADRDKLDKWQAFKTDSHQQEQDFWDESLQRSYRHVLGFRRKMLDYVRELRERGVNVAVASNFRRAWFKHLLEKSDLDEDATFRVVLISDQEGCSKPSLAFFQKLRDRGVPEHAIFVDDQEKNCVAAREAGFRTVWAHPAQDVPAAVERLLDPAA